LMLAALVVAVIGGVAVGVLAAVRQNRLTDHIARLFALIGSSIPIYWAALILLLIFNVRLHWLPGPGRLDPTATPPPNITGFYTVDSLLAGQFSTFLDAVRHLILPAFCLAWGVIGILSRIIRASMLEVLAQDYIRTARSKGLREMVVLLRHALRNALIPAMTIVGLSAGFLITGAVLVEEIFSWPGVGSYAVTSSEALDFPAIQGVALLGGTIFILANLITDIGYGLADPRVRLA
ncbi:MAG: ABC transporter permease, partial [Acidobacteriota bacterium]